MHTEELDQSGQKMTILESLVTLVWQQPYSRTLILHSESKQNTAVKGLVLVLLPTHIDLAQGFHNMEEA